MNDSFPLADRSVRSHWWPRVGPVVLLIAGFLVVLTPSALPVSWPGAGSQEANLLQMGSLATIGLLGWLIVSGVACIGARLTRKAALIRTVEWLTLPPVRRLAERVVALTLTFTTALGGIGRLAVADEVPPAATSGGIPAVAGVVSTSEDGGLNAPLYLPTPAGDVDVVTVVPPPSPPLSLPVPATVTGPIRGPLEGPLNPALPPIGLASEELEVVAGSPASGATVGSSGFASLKYPVRAGDNLWVISERHLVDVLGRPATDPETATYWVHVIRVNRGQLRSGDPDLIYPGEIVVLPPVAEVAPELMPGAEAP